MINLLKRDRFLNRVLICYIPPFKLGDYLDVSLWVLHTNNFELACIRQTTLNLYILFDLFVWYLMLQFDNNPSSLTLNLILCVDISYKQQDVYHLNGTLKALP